MGVDTDSRVFSSSISSPPLFFFFFLFLFSLLVSIGGIKRRIDPEETVDGIVSAVEIIGRRLFSNRFNPPDQHYLDSSSGTTSLPTTSIATDYRRRFSALTDHVTPKSYSKCLSFQLRISWSVNS